MLIIDPLVLAAIGPGAIHYAQILNKAVGNFVEKPGRINYEECVKLSYSSVLRCTLKTKM